ncbi:MAG: tRNA epoxyqueuosine(34) reductase QueG [Thermoleophilia bacterium]|nr:tRNA epoxyqueuosine(34) reductase QueG [Thermoleophilia bacterium]
MAPAPAPDTRTLREWAYELGIDELGICHAEPYDTAAAAIADRGAAGLFADLRFTMARPQVSCHPEQLVPGALSVASAALCYWQPDARPAGDGPHGRIARYTRADAYTALAERLEVIAGRLREAGYEARVLVDSNDHVDREAAIRSGVGFSGKHTNVITRTVGSWVVLGTLVTDAPLDPTPPLRPGCGSCTLCIEACPTDALADIAGGRLDATRCITYWTQSRHSIPLDVRDAMGDLAYGCDICQDACPWNRGVEGRRAGEQPQPWGIDLVEWLETDDDELDAAWQRLYVPRRQVRWLRRNALVALGNAGTEQDAALAAPWLDSDDAMLRDHAAWALRKLGGPIAAAALARAGA